MENRKREYIFNLISNERERQIKKWKNAFNNVDDSTTQDEWKACVLGEEVGEVNKAVLESNLEELEKELVQVSAVCVAWLECLKYPSGLPYGE